MKRIIIALGMLSLFASSQANAQGWWGIVMEAPDPCYIPSGGYPNQYWTSEETWSRSGTTYVDSDETGSYVMNNDEIYGYVSQEAEICTGCGAVHTNAWAVAIDEDTDTYYWYDTYYIDLYDQGGTGGGADPVSTYESISNTGIERVYLYGYYGAHGTYETWFVGGGVGWQSCAAAVVYWDIDVFVSIY